MAGRYILRSLTDTQLKGERARLDAEKGVSRSRLGWPKLIAPWADVRWLTRLKDLGGGP